MLFAALNDLGPQALREMLGNVTSVFGRPAVALEQFGAVLCAWGSASIDPVRGRGVEGWVELDGEATLQTMRGARGDFALMSLSAEGLLLGSGPAGGSRPIYVARPSSHAVVACSQLEPLLALLPSRPALDLDFLVASIAFAGDAPASKTPYTCVKRVPMGEAWLVGPGGIEQRCSTFRPMADAELRASGRELAARFHDALEGAVHRATRGADHVAVAASGGVDSSAVLALLSGLARRGDLPGGRPKAYAFDFDAPVWGDDRPYRRSLETHLRVDIANVRAEASAPFSLDQFVVDGAPCWSATTVLGIELGRRAVRDGAAVVLTGVGGDDVADGQPVLFAQLAKKGQPLEAVRNLLRLRGLMGCSRARRMRDLMLRPLARPFFPPALGLAQRRKVLSARCPWAGPRLRRYLDDFVNAPYTRPSLDESPGERYRQLLSLPVFGVTRMSRVQEEAAGGHVRRDPFLDDDFLRFVATIPPLSLMQGDFCRGLLREAMRGILPEPLRLRETKGPLEPACARMVEVAGGFRILEHLADAPMLADLQIVEPKLFRRRFDEIAQKPLQSGWPLFWAVLAAEAFVARSARDTARDAA